MSWDFPGCGFMITFPWLILGLGVVGQRAARAQVLGTIDGNVTDSSRAAIGGAKVVAREQATGFVRETVTNSAGVYTLPDLPPGTYTVAISSAGFQPYTRTGVVVTVQTGTRENVVVSGGGGQESVT